MLDENFAPFCNKKNSWNDKNIRPGPFKKFVNGLINYVLDYYEATHYYDIGGANGVACALEEAGLSVDDVHIF